MEDDGRQAARNCLWVAITMMDDDLDGAGKLCRATLRFIDKAQARQDRREANPSPVLPDATDGGASGQRVLECR